MYEVYFWLGDSLEFIGACDNLDRAGLTAQAQSLESGVSEVLIYDEQGALVEVWVDGNEVDAVEYMLKDFEQEFFEPLLDDEIGYNPYTGSWDMDL